MRILFNVDHLPQSKIKKAHTNMTENCWEATCPSICPNSDNPKLKLDEAQK